jgi:hypothetical protein
MGLDVFNLLAQIFATRFNVCRTLGKQLRWQRLTRNDLVLTRVCLKRANRGDQHRRIGHKARSATLDVEETLRTHVGAKARFGDEVIATMNADEIANDG